MPRYAPRSSFRTRLSTEEHPDSGDFAATTLDRVAFELNLARLREPTPPTTPSAAPPRTELRVPPTRWRALVWAPVVFLVAIGLGAMAGSLLAALGL